MLLRFSLYGFLKNQQYYEPFIILAFLEKGLSFSLIGVLVGVREISTVLLEIPSGAVADLYGRRRSMIASFTAYVASFVLLASMTDFVWLLIAMVLFSVGDAFRTGTHKAMIFDWLRREGRTDERTKVYGYTRSWSKIGSAMSALLAALFVVVSGSYASVFWLSVIPYVINIVNFAGYPKYLDGEKRERLSLGRAHSLALSVVKEAFSNAGLRRLFIESMCLEGIFKVNKDYLQPVLEKLALAIPLAAILPFAASNLTHTQKGAVVIGVVFALNFLLMSLSSRWSHRVGARLGGEEPLAAYLWAANLVCYTLMTASLILGLMLPSILFFILAGMIQNLFRPAQISRFDKHGAPETGATLLSVESQAKALLAAIVAPVVGLAVDHLQALGYSGVHPFWPAAALGVVTALIICLTRKTD
jgi:hypothetical protein